jgi:hypothetical protein
MGHSKKDRPLSPQEIARRKEAAQKQAQLNSEPLPKAFTSPGGKGARFTPTKAQNFRHQGR